MKVTWYYQEPESIQTDEGIARVVKWAKANGLDADEMPLEQWMEVRGDTLAVTVRLESLEQIQPGDEVTRLEVRRTVPLVEAPPSDLFSSHSRELADAASA